MQPLFLRHREYRSVLAATSLSSIGTQVSAIAIPLAALLVLHAGIFQVSVLSGVEALPMLIIGLPAGAWVDRLRRRLVMIVTDLVCALALAAIPICAWQHVLSIGLLYASGFVVGAATIMFDASDQAFLPTIVENEELATANSQINTVQSFARTVGPGIAGPLVQVLSAPYAIVLDAVSYIWSACWLATIRKPEPARPAPGARPKLRADVLAGVQVVVRHPVLRSIAAYNAFTVLFLSIERAIQMIFLVRVVGISATSVGLLTGLAAVGAMLGGVCSRPAILRFGSLRVMLASATACNAFMLLIPLAAHGVRILLFTAGVAGASFGIIMFNVGSITYRQQTVPNQMLGRANVTMRFTSTLLLPIGAVIGGALGVALGIRETLWIAAIGDVVSLVWLLPLRRPDETGKRASGQAEAPAAEKVPA